MFNTVYGSAELDHAEFVLKRVKDNIDSNIKSYILVPEQLSVFTERRIIEKLGARAQMSVEVLTFSRLAKLTLGELGPLRMRYIDGAAREIIAARTMQLIERRLEYFAPNASQRGFSSLMVSLVSEFKRYGVTPEMLSDAKKSVDNDELCRKLSDFALFYTTFNEQAEHSGSVAEDDLSLALPLIKDLPVPSNARLYITEFRSFTPLEYNVLRELMKRLGETTLMLCCDDIENPSDQFVTAAAAYRRLCDYANIDGVAVGRPERLLDERPLPADIRHLIRGYFLSGAEKMCEQDAKHIHILKPDSLFDEVEAAASIIHKLCRTHGYRQKDFLILARNTEAYAGIMPLVFEKAGINVFLDKRRCITQNPYVRCLTSVLEILAYGVSHERVISVARSGFCGGVSDEDIDIFENYLLAVNPSHAMWNDRGEWTYNPEKNTYDMERINRVKSVVLDPIFELKTVLGGRSNAAEIVRAVFEYMDKCGHTELMKDRCRSYAEDNMVYLAEEYRTVWNSVVAILSETVEIMGDTKIGRERFCELFKTACGGVKAGVSPQTIDGAVFSRIDMFRNTGARVVIVLGVNEGVFPKGYDGEGLISDSERMLLRSVGLELAQTAEERSFDENTLVYEVLAAASDELYLVAPKTDGTGGELTPSSIISRTESELFDIKTEHISKPEHRAEAEKMLLSAVSWSGGADGLSGVYERLYKYFDGSKRLSLFAERMKAEEHSGEPLSERMVTKLYGRDMKLSASKLEKFNACAFSYFMRYGLLAKPRVRAEFDPMQLGNVLHETMQRYFSDKRGETSYDNISKESCRADVDAIVREIASGADEVMYKNSAYYKYLVTRMSGIAFSTAWETVKFFKASEFRPLGFEIRIGDKGSVPPIRIETVLGNAEVEGFIDRVDCAVVNGKRQVSIVDYKSSARSLDQELAEAGVRFQPLVYANAMCGDDETETAAMLYQQMNDPIISADKAKTEDALESELHKNIRADGWVVKDEDTLNAFDKNHKTRKPYISTRNAVPRDELDRRLKAAEVKIAESAEGIFSGEISINPYVKRGFDPCSYCDYKNVCNHGA